MGRRGLVRGQGMKMGLVSKVRGGEGSRKEAGGCRTARRGWEGMGWGDPFRVEPLSVLEYLQHQVRVAKGQKRFCGRKRRKVY